MTAQMTRMSDPQAAAAIRAHHVEMAAELQQHVDALAAAVGRGSPYAEPQRELVEYLEGQVLPHAVAEEATLYRAADTGPTALLVAAMRAEHVNLIRHVEELGRAPDALAALAISSAVCALFESHLGKENDLLVPALVADPDVSLSALLDGMHDRLG